MRDVAAEPAVIILASLIQLHYSSNNPLAAFQKNSQPNVNLNVLVVLVFCALINFPLSCRATWE